MPSKRCAQGVYEYFEARVARQIVGIGTPMVGMSPTRWVKKPTLVKPRGGENAILAVLLRLCLLLTALAAATVAAD